MLHFTTTSALLGAFSALAADACTAMLDALPNAVPSSDGGYRARLGTCSGDFRNILVSRCSDVSFMARQLRVVLIQWPGSQECRLPGQTARGCIAVCLSLLHN